MDSEDEDEEEKETTKSPKFPLQMYISEGNKYFRLGKLDTAIEFFDTALEREPTNEKCLMGRSKCYMRLAKTSEAKQDAEAALRAYPKSCDAKMLIGEADYFKGDFESAFLTFHRGFVKRKNHEGLKSGHQMCRKAIDNALLPDKPMTFDDQDVEDLARLEDCLNNEQVRPGRTGKDQFSADIDFVNTLLGDDLPESVHSHCEFLKNYLRDRQVFWKTQKPNIKKENEF